MRRHVVRAVAALVTCLVAGSLYAGYGQAFGEVKSVDQDARKLVVAVRARRGEQAKEVTYLVDKDATIRIGREKKTLADIGEGKRVTIFFKEAEKEGELPKALLITVRGERRRTRPAPREGQNQ